MKQANEALMLKCYCYQDKDWRPQKGPCGTLGASRVHHGKLQSPHYRSGDVIPVVFVVQNNLGWKYDLLDLP